MSTVTVTREPRDRGSSLILVMCAMTVLMILGSTALAYSTGTRDFAVGGDHRRAALAAAEAGIDDYLVRLNRDENYWRKVDCTNVALRSPKARDAAACSWTTVGWRRVLGSPDAEFHYDVSVASTPIDGTIDVVATGRSGGETRSLGVTLRRGGFGEFLYYTVFETVDPDDSIGYIDYPDANKSECPRYHWASPARSSTCPNITFISGDRIRGPLHSNDSLLMTGSPVFEGTVSTSNPACDGAGTNGRPLSQCYRSQNATPTFHRGIAYRAEIGLPTNIGDLNQYVTGSPKPGQTRLGCLYTGPTRIRLLPTATGAMPMMRVWSRWSTTPLNPGCGSHTTLASGGSQDVVVPQNNVVVVRNVPSGQSSPASGACGAGSIGDSLPLARDATRYLAEANCRLGTLHVEGVMKGRLTLSAENDVVVTGNLTYAGGPTGTDALGLIAQNSVRIYHPIECVQNPSNPSVCGLDPTKYRNIARADGTFFRDPTLHAAILTLHHSFGVTAYQVGEPLGSLRLFGSFAQKFRGPVGRTSGNSYSGYLKDYVFDTRLRYAPPPYFLDPVQSGWGLKTYGELTPQH